MEKLQLTMYREKAIYEKDGKITEYYKYYLEVNGLKIGIKINDTTGKQIVNNEYEKNN